MNECIFCKIIKGELPSSKLYEDEKVFVFLDIKPISEGHTLVIPKIHSTNINDMDQESLTACMKAVKKLAPIIVEQTKADGFNLGNNNGKAAGQDVMHTHFHIIPRHRNDGFANWPNKEADPEDLKSLSEKIVNYLNK